MKLTPNARGQSQRAVFLSQDTGKTVFDAIRTFPHQTTRKLFWSHCQIFVLGREMAEDNVTQTLDWFYRNQELRPNSYVAMSANEAADILRTRTSLNLIPAYDVASDIETLTDTSDAPIVTLKDFMEQTANPIGTAYMPILTQKEVTGTAVFLHDRLVGTLGLPESRGLLSLNGKVKSGEITFPAQATTTGAAGTDASARNFTTLEIIGERVKTEVQVQNGRLTIVYKIRCTADLADDPSPSGHSQARVKEIEGLAAQNLTYHAQLCIARVKAYKADVIGAGAAIHRQQPKLWRTVSGDWERNFANLPIQVQTEVQLRHEGLIRGRI